MKKITKNTISLIPAMAVMMVTMRASAVNMPMGPFTFVGRVTDAEHMIVSENTIVRAEKEGVKLAECSTVHRDDSAYNYCLPIQLTDVPVKGYAQVNDALVLSVTDRYGKTWAGVVSAEDSIVGKSGGVRTLNIVLADNVMRNGVQIDRDLYDYLKILWEESDCYKEGEEFDVTKDHDGDGVPTIDEVFAGTDPFDKEDRLKIKDFSAFTKSGHKIVFTTKPARAYVIESAENLNGPWSEAEFVCGETKSKVLNMRRDDYEETKTVYLLPVESPRRFFRVRTHSR